MANPKAHATARLFEVWTASLTPTSQALCNFSGRPAMIVVPTREQVLFPVLVILMLTAAAAGLFATEWPVGYKTLLLPSGHEADFHFVLRSPEFMVNWSIATGGLCLIPWATWIVCHPFTHRSPAVLTLWAILLLVSGVVTLGTLLALSEAGPNRGMAFGLLLLILVYNLHFILGSLILVSASAAYANRAYRAVARAGGESERLGKRSAGGH